MKKPILGCCILLLILSGCGNRPDPAESWGSFTAEKTYSYDKAFYALQSTEEKDGAAYVVVSVCAAGDDGVLCSFMPARASDFWGVCWERDTYNLWIQSGDIGTRCYQYETGQWSVDLSAIRPDYIQSKYD